MVYAPENPSYLSCYIRSSQRLVVRLIAAALVGAAAAPAWADLDETYRLTLGGLLTDFETSVRINSRDNSIDEKISLENDLGFDSTVRSAWVKGYWRMGRRHRLSLLYTQFSRSSEKTAESDIEAGGNIILAGAFIGSTAQTHVFDVEYMYSLIKRPDLDLGLTAGLYWMNSTVELEAAGEVILEGETQSEFRSDYRASQRLIAPLPLIGLVLDYEFNDKWRALAAARMLDVTISEVDGYIFSAKLGAEYYFTRHVGLGANYAWFNLSVRYNGVVFIDTLAYEYDGVQAYLALKY